MGKNEIQVCCWRLLVETQPKSVVLTGSLLVDSQNQFVDSLSDFVNLYVW